MNFTVNLSKPEALPLTIPGGILRVPNRGFLGHGIYVVYTLEGEYAAYDATCTAHLEDKAVATEQKDNLATCPYCKREYNLIAGGISTKADYHLQPYMTTLEGKYLNVRN